MHCFDCELEKNLQNMERGDWGGPERTPEFFAKDAKTHCLGPRGVEYVKRVLASPKIKLTLTKDNPRKI